MIHTQDADFTLIQADVLDGLRSLEAGSVHCVVTSPPYWGLRDYSTDGQLGLEATPDLYVARMVEVFREVRRVLRADGTCWVNLGDSYANTGSGDISKVGGFTGEGIRKTLASGKKEGTWQDSRPRAIPVGLKPKDLVGIPWLVARALQEPYYTGRIKKEGDRIWLAAMVEAEGCMFIHRRKAGTSAYSKFTKKDGTEANYVRTQDTFGVGLEVSSTDRVIVERCMEIAGIGSVCEQTPEQNARRKQPLYRWNARTNECRDVIAELYPHMIAKQHEARLVLGCPSSGEKATKAWQSLKAIHQGQAASIDFDPPEPKWERGWFLRSDIIWSKPQSHAGVGDGQADESARVRVPAVEGGEVFLRPGSRAGEAGCAAARAGEQAAVRRGSTQRLRH